MSMIDVRLFCRPARHQVLLRMANNLLVAWLLVMCGGVLAQVNGADQTTGTPELLQRQGQQKQRLIQSQAATQLSRSEAKRLAASAQPAAAAQQPVSEAAVQLRREERIR